MYGRGAAACSRDVSSLRMLPVTIYGYIKFPTLGEKILIKSPGIAFVTLKTGVVGHTIDRCIIIDRCHS